MCRTCLYTAHVYKDDVTLNLGRYYIYVYTKKDDTFSQLAPTLLSYYFFTFFCKKDIFAGNFVHFKNESQQSQSLIIN
jgi:hypothetical protein